MTAALPIAPNSNVQLVDQQGRPTPFFQKLLAQLCNTAGDSLAARVAAVESANAINAAGIASLSASISALSSTVAGHTSHLNLLPAKRLTGTATYNPPSLLTGAFSAITTVSVAGAALGNKAEATFSLDCQGVIFNAWVSSAGVVSVVLENETGSTIDLASGTLTVFVWQ